MPVDWHQDNSDTVILGVTDATNKSSILMEDNVYLWTEPLHIANLRSSAAQIIYAIQPSSPSEGNHAKATTTAMVTLSSDTLALYVVLTTKASGRFSDNAFVLRPHQSKVRTGLYGRGLSGLLDWRFPCKTNIYFLLMYRFIPTIY